ESIRWAPRRAASPNRCVALWRFNDHRLEFFVRQHVISSHEHSPMSRNKSVKAGASPANPTNGCPPPFDPENAERPTLNVEPSIIICIRCWTLDVGRWTLSSHSPEGWQSG